MKTNVLQDFYICISLPLRFSLKNAIIKVFAGTIRNYSQALFLQRAFSTLAVIL